MKDTVLLEELSWPEVQEALDAGVRTVVIVAASVEQHGPHLPTMTDAAIGQAVGERVARKLGRALPNGVVGDATAATPEIGAAVLERLSDHLAAFARGELAGG